MLSITIPTYNEAKNIEELLTRISKVLKPINVPFEVLIVDDNSPDRTAQVAEALQSRFNVTVVKRPRKDGLASAVMNGFSLAKGDILSVMDADLSHPPEVMAEMYKAVSSGEADIVVGSRYTEGGASASCPWYRKLISSFAQLLARPITSVKDSGAGFFMFKRSVIEGVDLHPRGFKVLIEVLAKGNYSKTKEVPILFNDRAKGQSKLGMIEVLEYLQELCLIYYGMLTGKIKRKNKVA